MHPLDDALNELTIFVFPFNCANIHYINTEKNKNKKYCTCTHLCKLRKIWLFVEYGRIRRRKRTRSKMMWLRTMLLIRIRDPVLFYPWIRDKFIPDPEYGSGMTNFLYYEDLLLKPEGARKNVVFIFNSPFYVHRHRIWDPDPGKTFRIRNTGSAITLPILKILWYAIQ
jgi:hypothetical protein